MCYFLATNIYCFFDDQDTWLLLSEYFLSFFKCLRFLKGCLNAILLFPSHLQENLEKKHTHIRLFFFEKSLAKFFLKPFVFANQS